MRFRELATIIPSLQPQEEQASKFSTMDFVSAGIACQAFALIERMGILDVLQTKGHFDLKSLGQFKNPPAIKAALNSLKVSGVLEKENSRYILTSFGEQLVQQRGLITMLFDGYGPLMAKQVDIAQGNILKPSKYINGSSVALSSIQFGADEIDPLVIDVIKGLKPKRTICDLGCGTADRLIKVCQATGLPGLGLDDHSGAVRLAARLTRDNPHISVEKGDVSHLKGVWEDVEILMQSFMLHDIVPESEALQTLKSYKDHFPHFKYLLIVDIVAIEDDSLVHMPGFDYIHGLQNIEPRKYQETLSLFQKSGYKIKKEYQVGMPNTYLWLLARS